MSKGKKGTDKKEDVKVLERTKKPRKYKVILHNDNFTPRQFVVLVLEEIFRLPRPLAAAVMLAVHNSDRGTIGTWPRELAEEKSNRANKLAREYGFPLMTTTEPA